jgi:hypothetical protein
MHAVRLLFAQLMEHLPERALGRCIEHYGGRQKLQSFTCQDQFLCMAFEHLIYFEILRDIEVCLRLRSETL